MADERVFWTETSAKDYEEASSPFIVIPPGPSGVEAAGDTIALPVEAGMGDWYKQGISMKVPLTVTAEGINNGKQIDWFVAVGNKNALGITKAALNAFGIEDKVIRKNKQGNIGYAPGAFAGAQAVATFKRELSNKGNLRSVLDSTKFYPIGAVSEATTEESLT